MQSESVRRYFLRFIFNALNCLLLQYSYIVPLELYIYIYTEYILRTTSRQSHMENSAAEPDGFLISIFMLDVLAYFR